MGASRELKFALESYWKGASDADSLLTAAYGLRQQLLEHPATGRA